MKHFLLGLFSLLTISAAAQKGIIHPVNLSGLTSGRTVVIQEVLDHAVLLHEDPAQAIVGYELVIVSKKPTKEKMIKMTGPAFSPEALDYLKTLKGKKGTIVIRNVMTERGSVIFETPHRIELTFME
ncbi:MAG TPA: hypothetical protein VL092_04435 [Chitinophagaceae bacterium]|nr:hypothetical protein [Chitinophagaceae bacterium]